MKTLITKFKFWLTVDVICSWCNNVKHHAPLWFFGDGGASHGICKKCKAKFLEKL